MRTKVGDFWDLFVVKTNASIGYKMDRGFFRRTLPPTRSDDGVCIDKIKHWIDECIRDHGCGLDIAQRGLPTRLVDVSPDDRTEGLRLAIGSEILAEDTPFAALSHCWGDKKDRIKAVPKTTMATLSRHLEKIEWDDLTPTFRDTINRYSSAWAEIRLDRLALHRTGRWRRLCARGRAHGIDI